MKRALRIFSLLVLATSLAAPLRAAEQFGDISIEPAAIYTGNTYHGYAETRVVVENHSQTKAHVVTLSNPNRSYNYGNGISRVSRDVKLEPGAREVVTLLQPPLPAQGDNQIHVEVDGRGEGDVHAPNANSHCNYNYRGGSQMTVAFVSRSLDFDAINLMMQPNNGTGTPGVVTRGFSSPASEAVGVPGAFRSGRRDLSAAWMPNFRAGRSSAWLELDYMPTQAVDKVVIHSVQAQLTSGNITLLDASGTNLLTQPMSAANIISDHGQGWDVEFSFPLITNPVKTVRIEFGAMQPRFIAIDGVKISGPSGSQWADSARASSENSSPPPPMSYSSSSSGGDNIECLRAESPVSEWSENWLAYTPFDAVIVNAADLGTISPAVLAALGDYLHAGGNVVFAGRTTLPDSWHPSSNKKLHDGVEFDVGLGRCFALNTDNTANMDPLTVQRLREVTRESARYWQGLPNDSGAANSLLPVVENLKIPTRGIVIIMLAFIILIGPVNIVYLNRRKRRTWMLWTIPVISLITTLLVFVYSLLREGITPDTRITGFTVLDQTSHHAATVGGTAFYCPLTPSSGLHFEFGTEATPLVESGYGSGSSREVDWTQSQHFQRGWVSARVPVHFHLRKSETRRERIQVVTENGKLQAVNSLGAPIKGLWVADANGKIHQAYNIAAGQKAELILSTVSTLSEKTGAGGMLHDMGFAMNGDSTPIDAAKYLQPGTYIATLEGNPFIENGLGSAASAKRTKSTAVVFGILESSETK